MHISGSSSQTGLGKRRVLRPAHAVVASITAATLVFGALFVAVPGQADEAVEPAYIQMDDDMEESTNTQDQSGGEAGDAPPLENDAEGNSESEGSESEGTESEGTESEGTESEGTESEGTESEGTESEGTESEGTESESEFGADSDLSADSDTETLEAEDAAGRGDASISTDASTYQAGQKVTVAGEGWSHKDPVTLNLLPSVGAQFPVTPEVDKKSSAFAFTFTLPWEPSGSYEITATQDKKDSPRTATTSFTVQPLDKPVLEAQIDESGSAIRVTGSGWSPDEFVSITTGITTAKSIASKSRAEVAGDGTVQANVELPQDRESDIELIGTGDLTGRTAAVTLSADPSAVITIRKAGSRTSTTAASPLDGAVFDIYDVGSSTTRTIPSGATPAYTCTTGVGTAPGGGANAGGECSVEVSWASGTSRRFLVVEQSAPSGWSLLPAFATDDSGTDPYTFNVRLEDGDSEVVPNIGSEQWANRLANPDWPGICGLDIALLFDESTSISSSEWTQMKTAAGTFVQALQGTPSRVAQFSFSTTALTGKYVPLTSVQSASDAAALISQINGKSQSGGFTNWDEGLFQIAQATESYDAVLVLTDGDPTVWGTETNGDVRLVTVQEAVHSANAIKAEGTRVVGVGIGLSGSSEKNLAGISGPTAGSDYYLPAGFGDLDDALKEIASALCGGTVLIEKQLGASIPGSTNSDSNGWPFSSEITANGANTNTVATPANEETGILNDKNGQLQFKYVGGEWPKSVRITELVNPDAPGFSLEDIQCTGNDLSPSDVSVSGNAVTISNIDIDETVSCIFLNNRDTGSLRVLKDVSNPGGAVLPDDFGIDYECVIDDAVTKSGAVDVPAGAAGVVVSGVPTGSTCTITEQALTPIPGFTWSPVSYDPRSVLVDQAGAEFTVKAVNTITRDTGSLQLVKALSGGPDGFTGPFEIEYSCTLTDASDITGSRSVSAGASATVTGIPSGYECVVSEPVLPTAPSGYSFGAPSFTPTNATVVIEKDATATVTTQNTLTRDTGSLQLVKALSGGPDGFTGPFEIEYSCTLTDASDIAGSRSVSAGASATVTGIPSGYECVVSEPVLPTAPSGYSFGAPSFTPTNATVVIGKDTIATVITQNNLTRDTGSLQLVKALSGGPDGFTGPFTIEYQCSMENGIVPSAARVAMANGMSPISGSLVIAAGSSSTVGGIPTGYECVVSEPVLPDAPTGYSFGAPTFEPANATVVIEKDTAATVITQNSLTRDVGNLRITKSLTGTPAGYDPDFDVSYLCTLDGEEDIAGSATVVNGGTVEVPTEGGIPTGYECTVTEGALPALPAGYVWNVPEYSNNQETTPGNVVTIVDNTVPGVDQEIPEDQMATVAIANSATFTAVPVTPASAVGGALNVSKTLIGGPAGFAPAFAVAWSCSSATGSLSGVLSLAPGDDATVFNVPNGYSCTVSEDDLPGAPDGFSWAPPQIIGSPTAVISGNATVVVSVVNTLVANEVAPVEPASPDQPPVEEAPVEPASVPGVPTVIPAGGGALIELANSLPIWIYLAVVLGAMVLISGLAYRSRSRSE